MVLIDRFLIHYTRLRIVCLGSQINELSATLSDYPNFDGGVVVIFIYFLSMYCSLLIEVDNPSIFGGATSLISVPSSITLSASAQSQQAPNLKSCVLPQQIHCPVILISF